jgi:DNA-binding XRE family transcriptional regulator
MAVKVHLSCGFMVEKTGPRLRANRQQQEALCKLFQKARADASLSQEALAKKLGKPQSFVSKYESGARRLGSRTRIGTLIRLRRRQRRAAHWRGETEGCDEHACGRSSG